MGMHLTSRLQKLFNSKFLRPLARIKATSVTQHLDNKNSRLVCTGRHIKASEFLDLLREAEDNHDPTPNLSGKCLHEEDLSQIKNLRRLRLDRANLQGACLAGCNLQHASLKGANLTNAELYDADLSNTNLEKAVLYKASLMYADLTRANLSGANLKDADLKGAIFDRTAMRLTSLGKHIKQEREGNYLDAQSIYLALKENFQSIGLYDAASWAYVRERVTERFTFAPWRAMEYYGPKRSDVPGALHNTTQPIASKATLSQRVRKVQIFVEQLRFWVTHNYWWKWLTGLAQEWVWGYGQRPARVINVCLVIIPLFALIYHIDGGIQSSGRPLDLKELIVYSLATFTTSTIPDVSPVSTSAQVWSSLEGIFGVTTLALFTTALAQRMGGR